MNKTVGFESRARRARNALRVETEFEVFFFALLGLSEGFILTLRLRHDRGAPDRLPLLFGGLAIFDRRDSGGFAASGWRLMPSSSQR